MPADAYQEFLQANSARNYPFVEDASLMADGGGYELPPGFLLNLRGFTRQQPEDPEVAPRLVALIGSGAPVVSPGDEHLWPDGAGWTAVFSLGTLNQDSGQPQYLRVVVKSGSDRSTTTGFVPSPFAQSLPAGDMTNIGLNRDPDSDFHSADDFDYLAAMIDVTLSPEALDMLPADDTLVILFSNALIEPTLITRLWRTEVERLVFEDQCWDESDVSGHVILREGYNTELVRLGSSILVSPARRAGLGTQPVLEFEAWLCDVGSSSSSGSSGSGGSRLLELHEPCEGNILKVNGVTPDVAYNLTITGENGVTVQSFPNEHRIVITLSLPQPIAICPD